MILIKMAFFLLITVYLSVTAAKDNDNDNVNDRQIQIKMATACRILQDIIPDRGYVARPVSTLEALMSKSPKELNLFIVETHKELHCSFLLSALVHVYLTRTYLMDLNAISQLTKQQVTDINFLDISLISINYVYVESGEHKWSCITKVMWIFHMHAMKTAGFIKSHRRGYGSQSQELMLSAHNAVRVVLEEFIEAYGCKVYRRETGEPETVRCVDRMKEIIEGKTTGIPLTGALNKKKFYRQVKKNQWPLEGIGRFALRQMRMCYLLKEKNIMDKLVTTFGVQLDSYFIVENLIRRYRDTFVLDVPLHKYINCFITLQSEFLIVLKAIAIRLIVVYLTCTRQLLSSFTLQQQYTYLTELRNMHNREMLNFLVDFITYIGQQNDEHVGMIIQLLKQGFWSLNAGYTFDELINNTLEVLEHMSSGNEHFAQFSDPMIVDGPYVSQWMVEVKKVAEVYNLQYSDEDTADSVKETLLITKVFVDFVKEITKTVNFDLVNSFISLKQFHLYERLKHVETCNDH